MTRDTESGFHEVTGDYAKIFAPVYRPKGYAGQPDGACRLCGRPTDYLRCWDCTERGAANTESRIDPRAGKPLKLLRVYANGTRVYIGSYDDGEKRHPITIRVLRVYHNPDYHDEYTVYLSWRGGMEGREHPALFVSRFGGVASGSAPMPPGGDKRVKWEDLPEPVRHAVENWIGYA